MHIIYEGRIIKVFTKEISFEDGHSSTYEFVEHKPSVALIPIIEDKIIIVEQYRPAVERKCLEIPAGLIESDENPIETARRELEEETGYYAENIIELLSAFSSPGFSTEKTHFFLAQKLKKTQQKLDPDEEINVKFFTIEKLMTMTKKGKIQDGKTIIGLFLASQYLKGNL